MIKVKRLDPRARIPTVAHAGSDLGFDLYALEDTLLPPGIAVRVRTGVALEGPPGMGFVLGDRSSMAMKGITYAGGRIDAGYRGEILVCLINLNQPAYSLSTKAREDGALTNVELHSNASAILLRAGDKIVQASPFQAMTHLELQEVDELSEADRGTAGFGSSGR